MTDVAFTEDPFADLEVGDYDRLEDRTGLFRRRLSALRALLLLWLVGMFNTMFDPEAPLETLLPITAGVAGQVEAAHAFTVDEAAAYLSGLAGRRVAVTAGIAERVGRNDNGVPLDEVTKAAVGVYVNRVEDGRTAVEAEAAAQAYLNRIAATEPYRMANETLMATARSSDRFTGRWRRIPNPGACPACVALANRGWSAYDDVAMPAHPNCGCTIEPEVKR